MKNRNPISSTWFQRQTTFYEEDNEFIIQRDTINYVEITSHNGNRNFGAPQISIAINGGQVVGVTCPIDCSLSNRRRCNSLTESDEGLRFDEDLDPSFLGRRMEVNSKSSIETLTERPLAKDLALKTILEKIKILLEKKFRTKLFPHQSIRLTYAELFKYVIVAIEDCNQEWKETFSIEREYYDLNFSSLSRRIMDSDTFSMLYASGIFEKRLWYVNLKSHEVIVDRNGICFRGHHYIPVEKSDLFHLQKLAEDHSNPMVTIYVHPKHRSLFWVESRRLIRLKPRERASKRSHGIHISKDFFETTNSNF